ncbi:MAG: sulfur carrier protein ThiS [Chloroflexi bacterium]|nr:sulfur carrier protein ThiS [Chloroflexota bacterium]
MIRVQVNGKERALDSPTGLVAFLQANGLQQRMIAVGYNGEVVHKENWSTVVLDEGDVIDIVQMVGGG